MKSHPLFVSTLLGFLWLVAMATPAAAAPDLVPIQTNPPNGTVGVRNAGTTAAGPTKLLVSCKKVGFPGPGGGCPEIPPDQLAAYSDPAFPDQVVVRIPALRPGQRFEHRLTFWDQLCWPAGGAAAPAPAAYVISARADAANSEAEGVDEGNNYVESTLVSQRRDCPAGPAGPDAKPDLVPISNDLTTRGTAIVWNNGTVAAGPTLLLVRCVAGGGGRCPPIPPDQMAAYSDPAFPNQIVVKVPALQPRTRFDHHLTFWNSLCWPAGSYVISATADVANSVAESNENNNYAEGTLVSTRPNCPAALPDLTPTLTTPFNGTVVVQNIGRADGYGLMHIFCRKEDGARCPPALNFSYGNSFVGINTPRIQPGERFVYQLPLWTKVCWPAGRYQISAKVMVGAGGESNRNNNEATSTLVSQRSCSAVPRPPFDPGKPPHATPVPGKPVTPIVPIAPQPVKGK